MCVLTREFSAALQSFLQIHLPVSIQGAVRKYCGYIDMFSWNPHTVLWRKCITEIFQVSCCPWVMYKALAPVTFFFRTVFFFFPAIWDPKCFSEFLVTELLLTQHCAWQQKHAPSSPMPLAHRWAAAPAPSLGKPSGLQSRTSGRRVKAVVVLRPCTAAKHTSPVLWRRKIRKTSTKVERSLLVAFSVGWGVAIQEGIKPCDGEEAVGYTTHWGCCHYSVRYDARRSSPLRHTEENQQKGRLLMNCLKGMKGIGNEREEIHGGRGKEDFADQK